MPKKGKDDPVSFRKKDAEGRGESSCSSPVSLPEREDGSVRDVGVGETQDFREVDRCDFDLVTDLARAEKDHIERSGRLVDHGFELFFHPDGRTASVDVTGEGEKLFGFDYFDGFSVHRFRRFFEVEFGIDRYDKDEMFAALLDRDERFEHMSRVLPKRGGNFQTGNRAGFHIAVVPERHFGLLQDAHDVCFELGCFAHGCSPRLILR